MENYCEAYHLPFVHPDLNSYSRLEDHYNILDDDSYAGQGSHVYAPQISADGQQFPAFDGLSEKWDKAAEYCAFFPNVLYGVHKDHAFAIVLVPTGRKQPRSGSRYIMLMKPHKARIMLRCGQKMQQCGNKFLLRISVLSKVCRPAAWL